MNRVVAALIAAGAICALVACEETPKQPPQPGNLEAGRPPESQAGAYINEAKKVQDTINVRPDQIKQGVEEGGAGAPSTP